MTIDGLAETLANVRAFNWTRRLAERAYDEDDEDYDSPIRKIATKYLRLRDESKANLPIFESTDFVFPAKVEGVAKINQTVRCNARFSLS